MLTSVARAKVNLFLHITGKREDGYHLLESLVVFPDAGDVVTVDLAAELDLSVTGPFMDAVEANSSNLVMKAAALLRSHANVGTGAHISLEKNLPVAAGIGGGSADAAVTLRLLNTLWRTGVSEKALAELGLELGADVPVCLRGKPAIMSGIGEKISEFSRFPKLYIILVNSKIMVSTADVFRRLKIPEVQSAPFELSSTSPDSLIASLSSTRNDLQSAAISIVPEIQDVLSMISGEKGCQLSRMSGSGGTCFGLFPNYELAAEATRRISEKQPDWWVRHMVVGNENVQ